MRLELEDQVKTVDKQQDHTCTTADSQNCRLSSIGLFLLERGVEGSLINGQYNVIDDRQKNSLPEAKDS